MCGDARCVRGGRGRVGYMTANNFYVVVSFFIIIAYLSYYVLR
jgi:hypothetical protein